MSMKDTVTQTATESERHSSTTLPDHQDMGMDIESQQQREDAATSGGGVQENAEAEEFVTKYGDIDFSFIEPPPHNPWFTQPHALNYFHNGRLFRTRHERTSGRFELFLDLVYVGIAANLASSAVKEHTWASLGKYILVFIPAWQIWCDLKDFMNYYFSDDFLQRTFVLFQLMMLIVYDNNCLYVDDLDDNTALVASVTAYFLAKCSFSAMLAFYSLYIKEHRFQLRLYSLCTMALSSCWWFILLIHSNWGKCVFASILFFLEQMLFCAAVHPWMKRNVLKLEYSTALNIEHEDERFHAFYIISIGEFLYSIVAGSPLGVGWNTRLAKGLALLIAAFMFMGFYASKDGSFKATHAMRRSANTAMLYIYTHFVAIASLLVVGDAGADLCKIEERHLEHEEFGVLVYYHGGILVALISLTILAMADKDRSDPGDHYMPKWARIGFRVPVGCLILGLTWAYEKLTIVQILWLDTLFLVLLMMYELTVMNPYRYFQTHRVIAANH